jgi:hypothetical protein
MTRRGATDAVVPTCSRVADGPVSALIAFRARGSVWHIPREPTSARPVSPRVTLVHHACGRFAGQLGWFRSAGRGSWCPRVSEQRFSSEPTHRIYSHLLKQRTGALYGCSVDPGREMLCTFSSPRWLQWP